MSTILNRGLFCIHIFVPNMFVLLGALFFSACVLCPLVVGSILLHSTSGIFPCAGKCEGHGLCDIKWITRGSNTHAERGKYSNRAT